MVSIMIHSILSMTAFILICLSNIKKEMKINKLKDELTNIAYDSVENDVYACQTMLDTLYDIKAKLGEDKRNNKARDIINTNIESYLARINDLEEQMDDLLNNILDEGII